MDENLSNSVWIHKECCNKIRYLFMLLRGCLLALQDPFINLLRILKMSNKNANQNTLYNFIMIMYYNYYTVKKLQCKNSLIKAMKILLQKVSSTVPQYNECNHLSRFLYLFISLIITRGVTYFLISVFYVAFIVHYPLF